MRFDTDSSTFVSWAEESGARVFEELADWEVRATRDWQIFSVGVFRQSYPEDAVILLMAVVRTKLGEGFDGWPSWSFWCIRRDGEQRPGRTLLYVVSPSGGLLRLADSRLGGLVKQGAANED